MSARLALVVGNNTFRPGLSELEHCVQDAEAVQAALEIENYGFDVVALLGAAATKAAITQKLLELGASRPDVLCFYYAGHGVTDATGTFLATSDGQPFDEGIEVSQLVARLSSDSDHPMDVLVLLDCCNAGAAQLPGTALATAEGATGSSVTQAFKSAGASNRAVIGACLADQPAVEQSGLGHGVFTYHLVEGLMGGAADHEGNVTLSSLYNYICVPFSSITGQTPFAYTALAGSVPLGTGLAPRMAPPLEVDEVDRLIGVAQDLADSHRRKRNSADWYDWEGVGFRGAAQDLAAAVRWFEKQLERSPQLDQHELFASAWETVQRYRADLGSLTQGVLTPVGRAVERLGQGSFGTVWRVETGSGASVAYKTYHPNDLRDVVKSSRFRRGYEAMTRLDHPRVVRVGEYTEAPLGFTMDFVEGGDLRGLGPAASMEIVQMVFMLSAVAEAISHAHDRGVVHRDIKPENIVCRYDQELGRWDPLLTDFDLAWINTGTQVTRDGIGNLRYAAPEQFINFSKSAVTGFRPALDVFSFGQLSYFCVTGSDPSPTVEQQNRENFQRAVAKWPSNEAAGRMLRLYELMTAFESRERIDNMSAVLDELREIHSRLGVHQGSALDIPQFLAELQFAFTGVPALDLAEDDRERAFLSTSRQTNVVVCSRRVGGSRGSADFTVDLSPNGRIGWEGVPNGVLRAKLNKRIADVVDDYAWATWHPGSTGVYQVFVEAAGVPLDRAGLSRVRRLMTAALTKIESFPPS